MTFYNSLRFLNLLGYFPQNQDLNPRNIVFFSLQILVSEFNKRIMALVSELRFQFQNYVRLYDGCVDSDFFLFPVRDPEVYRVELESPALKADK